MKKVSLLLFGIPALALSLMLVWLDPTPFAGLSHQIHDTLLRAHAVPPRAGAVVMVDIDDASLARLGQWPWSRRELGKLVDNLWEHGAAVVVFDMVFPEPDRSSPQAIESLWRSEYGPDVSLSGIPRTALDHDADFAASLGRGRSLMGCYFNLGNAIDDAQIVPDPLHRGRCFETGRSQRDKLPQGTTIIQSLPVLRTLAAGEAPFNTLTDRDNVIRRTPLLIAYGPNRIYPALPLEALRVLRGANNIRVRYDNELGQGVAGVTVGGLDLPTDANGCLVLNFRSTPFPRIPAWKVLDGERDIAVVSNKVVLIGTSAAGLHDLKATPLSSDLPGIEVHATALDNMLAGDALREPRWMFHANLIAVALAGLAMIVLVASSRSWHAFLTAAAFVVLALGTSKWALTHHLLVVSPVGMTICTIMVYTSMTVVKYWQEERERSRIRTMFATMVSTDVLRLMEENPNSFSLAGRKTEVTVLFSDIANFTRLAENLDPDILTKLINRYLTEMTTIIMARGGYVDKFDGDAIMAVWGAPYAIPNHALQACQTALDQMECLTRLNQELSAEFGCHLEIRIGLNTGVVTAGNMGSANRFQYTVMGDAVNVGARLEDANRLCGTRILIGEATWARVHDQVETRQLGLARIRGKTKPVQLYELLAHQGELTPAMNQIIRTYAEALSAYHERQWDKAAALTQAILVLKPDDGPARLLHNTALQCKSNPPPDNWDLVLNMGA